MSTYVLATAAAITLVIKSAGAVIVGARALPLRISRAIDMSVIAVLTTLVLTSTLTTNTSIHVDARLIGVAAGAVALTHRRSSVTVAAVAAVATTALVRLFQ